MHSALVPGQESSWALKRTWLGATPTQEMADGLARSGRQVTFSRLPSLQGHDAFLVDMDRFRRSSPSS
jgi:hypothetical protein